MTAIFIREIREDDDFQRIYDLTVETGQRMNRIIGLQQRIRCAPPNTLKQKYFPDKNQQETLTQCKGFVAESNGRIEAYMDVSFPDHTRNGYAAFGFSEGYEHVVKELLERCRTVVRENGGAKLYQFAVLLAGQIRNYQITFWEKYGYVSDPYFYALIKLEVDEWVAPVNLDTSLVEPVTQLTADDIVRMLQEDGEEQLASELLEEIKEKTPDFVTVALKDESSNEITAFSYYRVAQFKDKGKDGKIYDGLGAWGVGFHFRPQYQLSRQEKRRFIDCTIQTMKELGIIFASARVSSRDFSAFVEMMASGFCFQAYDPLPIVNARLSLEV